jgi:hypothetical protein
LHSSRENLNLFDELVMMLEQIPQRIWNTREHLPKRRRENAHHPDPRVAAGEPRRGLGTERPAAQLHSRARLSTAFMTSAPIPAAAFMLDIFT